MQKLEGINIRNQGTPQTLDCGSVIKHDCGVGQVSQNSKTLSNGSDVDHSQHGGSSDLRVQNIVYVLNMRGQPLMPTKQQKANKLLKQNKAKVVRRNPFTIQLKYPTGESRQPIKLGTDTGYTSIGFSAMTSKRELLSGELKLRANISKLLEQRKDYRRKRRYRLWHRKPGFNGKPIGWLAPSIQHKLDSHIRLIGEIMKILPITEINVEPANFDIQKIKNPDIQGEEYQNGALKGFWNVREYVLHRDNHLCQHCKGKSKDKILQVHHVHGKKEGATDRPDELLTVCKTCHDNHHKGINIIPDREIHRFKPETFMSMVRWKLVNQLKEMYGDIVHYTYGHITKHNRISMGIEKSHVNDAFIIAGGTTDVQRTIPYNFKQVRRNNRSIQTNRKGFKPSIRRHRYKLQPNDLVRYGEKICRVKGVFNYGSWVRLIDGLENVVNSNVKNVELIKYGKGIFG